MGTRSEYVNEFISVQELESVKRTTTEPTVSLNDDDLFLVSQLSAEADSETPVAVAVSRKLRYGDLVDKVAEDIDLGSEQGKLNSLSSDLSRLSSYTHIDINNRIDNLSVRVAQDYVKQYDLTVDVPKGYTISNINVKDGQIEKDVGLVALSDQILITGMAVAAGVVDGTTLTTYTYTLTTDNVYVVSYEVQNDCYLAINVKTFEMDSMENPIEVSLGDVLKGNDKSSDMGRRVNLKRVAQMSNPGAFSGKLFKIYYSCCVPVKAKTKVQVYYYTLDDFRYKADNPSTFTFRELKIYATISESEIDTRVRVDSRTMTNSLSLYKVQTNSQGLVVGTQNVSGNDLTSLIGLASVTNKGVVGTNYTRTGLNFPVRTSSGDLYTQMTQATASSYGVVKIGRAEDHSNPQNQIIPLSVDQDGKAFTKFGIPTSTSFGIIKSGVSHIYSGTSNEIRQIYVDTSGVPKVDLPVETWTFTLKDGRRISKSVSVSKTATAVGNSQTPTETSENYVWLIAEHD